MQKYIDSGKMPVELVASLKKDITCNKSNYPPAGIQKDQILEVFADWFSAEVIAKTPKYIDQSLRKDLCKPKELMKGSSYLSNKDRLEKIYLNQPIIQKKLNLEKPSAQYCSWN